MSAPQLPQPESIRGEQPGAGESANETPAMPPNWVPPPTPASQRDSAVTEESVRWIGRFRVERRLGQGGFGAVYLALDEELNRRVAIKVPKRMAAAQVAEYREEAQKLAKLEHPGVVPIFEIGHTDQFPVFLVTKYLEGGTLSDWVQRVRPDFLTVAKLIAEAADALHATHLKGIFHRDIKPANILVDAHGKPCLADFGLALKEGHGLDAAPEILGTPAYMSPEQAAGEGHRVDGQTDIFSLGVVLYELLAGVRPFRASEKLSPREQTAQLLEFVKTADPRPPRQINDDVPKELERICLKALAKRKPDRYTTARDMAEDLKHFAANPAAQEAASVRLQLPYARDPGTQPQTPTPGAASTPQVISDREPLKIVPKGLRSFDAGDASFFLDLLPGPRDREGLPESVRFWKTRLESFDPDVTFASGVLYGPSGCGKSSLVKAGLIPRLAEHIVPIYIEASGDDTEQRLARAIRRACPEFGDNLSLALLLKNLRRGIGLPSGKKAVLILDQFEQWLHAKRGQTNLELPAALRQCDGERLQCLILVRDDFWQAISRFLEELEVSLNQGRNCAMADLFDPPHARKVLDAFLVAHAARVSPSSSPNTPSEQASRLLYDQFLEQSVAALAEEGKIISVRLALFAEMVKSKPWTPQSLKAMGGVEGVGVKFLEDNFGAAHAPIAYRSHEKSVRGLLKALLPESGTDLKGHRVTCEQLQESAGLSHDPRRFAEVLRILDPDLRLITPVGAEAVSNLGAGVSDEESVTSSSPIPGHQPLAPASYQLAHDYLVPSIRNWLTKGQRETRKGRAELRLDERSALWHAKPLNRHLPDCWEHLNIRWYIHRKSWSPKQHTMMHRSARVHGTRVLLSLLLLVALTVVGLRVRHNLELQRQQDRAAALVKAVATADLARVPQLVTDLAPYRQWADAELRQIVAQEPESSTAALQARLALLPVDDLQAEPILQRLLSAEPTQVEVLRQALVGHHSGLTQSLWTIVEQPNSVNDAKLLHAASALAAFESESDRWSAVAPRLVERLVNENPLRVAIWIETLQPVKKHLLPSLAAIFRSHDGQRTQTQIDLATNMLERCAADDVTLLSELLFDAEPRQFRALFDEFAKHAEAAVQILDRELDKKPDGNWDDKPLDPNWPTIEGVTRRRIENAHGLVAERFAFCQTLPLEQLTEVAAVLAKSGYRPISVRPTAAPANSVIVAIVWWRDGRDSRLLHGLTVEEVLARDEMLRSQGWTCRDVAGYVTQVDGNQSERFSAAWVQQFDASEEVRIYVGWTGATVPLSESQGLEEFPFLHRAQQYRGADGKTKTCGVKWRFSRASVEIWETVPSKFNELNYPDMVHWDVALSHAADEAPDDERQKSALIEAEAAHSENGDKFTGILGLDALFYQRGLAHFYLRDDAAALADLNRYLEKTSDVVSGRENFWRAYGYQLRAKILARLGRRDAALADVLAYRTQLKTNDQTPSPNVGTTSELDDFFVEYLKQTVAIWKSKAACLDVVVAAFLGDDVAAIRIAEARLDAKELGLYDGACGYSQAAGFYRQKDEAKATRYADRAMQLLSQAVAKDPALIEAVATDPDLAAIREHPEYRALLVRNGRDIRYAAVWKYDAYESAERHGIDPTEHLEEAQKLTAAGYRPGGWASLVPGPDRATITASVWQRPILLEDQKERLAKRQANAAVALLRMTEHAPEKQKRVWTLLKHSPDPRLRSWLIHRFASAEADEAALVERLKSETDVTIRRALILSLGEYHRMNTPARPVVPSNDGEGHDDRTSKSAHPTTALLLGWYRSDPDPGIHGAAEWVLRKWGLKDELAKIDQELATGQAQGRRQWYVTKTQNHTLAVISDPNEFLMGAPATEQGYRGDEPLHRRRISQPFCIATKEVSMQQLDSFLTTVPEIAKFNLSRHSPEPDCPWAAVDWFDAARYCRWLSEQEGIAEEQMCFPRIPQITEWMTLPFDYAERTGYRLPTEAEWEFACRSGAVTSRYYGSTDELLGQYAWILDNSSKNRSWPSAMLKPNEFGLFDILGNALEWNLEVYQPYPNSRSGRQEVLGAENDKYVMRGGAFNSQPQYVRCGYRFPIRRSDRGDSSGFRVARTHKK